MTAIMTQNAGGLETEQYFCIPAVVYTCFFHSSCAGGTCCDKSTDGRNKQAHASDCKRNDDHSAFHRLVDLRLARQPRTTHNTPRSKRPLIDVHTLLKHLFLRVRGTRDSVRQELRQLDLTASAVAVASAESYALHYPGDATIDACAVVLRRFENGLPFFRSDLHLFRSELVHERFQRESH